MLRLLPLVASLALIGSLPAEALDRAAVERDLAAREQSEPATDQGLSTLKADDAYQRHLRQWDLLRRMDDETLAAWEADPSRAKLLARLLDDPAALTALLESGPIPDDMTRVLDLLWRITQQNENVMDDPISRDTAIAFAIEGVRRDLPDEATLSRADFYVRSGKDRRLHMAFEGLRTWERRFIAHGLGLKGLNEVSSLTYLLEHVHLPVQDYARACWRAPYRWYNAFGDSVQRPGYYDPFEGFYGSAAEMIDEQGGVCGALSNFGAAAAMANGIPAMTMGEPGHCAYAIRVKPGQWMPAYTLSWKRSPHAKFFSGGWEALIATDECFNQPERVADALEWRRLSERFDMLGKKDLADEALWRAVAAHPSHLNLWTTLGDHLHARAANPDQWQRYHDAVLEQLLPAYPEAASSLLINHAYPPLLAEAKSPSERVDVLLPLHRALRELGRGGRWEYEKTLQFAEQQVKDRATFEQMLLDLLSVHHQSNTYFGICLGWAAGHYKDRPEQMRAVAEAVSQGGADPDTPNANGEAVMAMARKALPEAATRGDRVTFQIIGQLTEPYLQKADYMRDVFKGIEVPEPEGFPLSDGGLLATSSSRYDKPEAHWGVITPTGGLFHTGNEMNPHAEIGLGTIGQPEEIVIVTRRGGYQERMVPFRIMVSSDRKTWQEVYRYEGKPSRVYHITLPKDTPTAQWVRFEKIGGGPIHLSLFRVFGKKQS